MWSGPSAIQKNMCMDCPYTPTLLGTYSKYNYTPRQQIFFDNEMIAQIFDAGFEIGEVTCPTKYFDDASSINLKRSIQYGIGVLGVSFGYFFKQLGLYNSPIYKHKH